MNAMQTPCPVQTADQSTARRRRAFTLLELPAAVLVVTVVTGILFPVFQPFREQYARDQAAIISEHLRLSALDYRAHFGGDADTLQQILAFDPPPFALTLQDDDIAFAPGYKFRYVKLDTSLEFLAVPGGDRHHRQRGPAQARRRRTAGVPVRWRRAGREALKVSEDQ